MMVDKLANWYSLIGILTLHLSKEEFFMLLPKKASRNTLILIPKTLRSAQREM
jgi:hypothetical protein